MHCFEGPEWLHLRRGRESFARGPLVKVDPQGRCGSVLVYGLQMIILKASQVSSPPKICILVIVVLELSWHLCVETI